MEKKNFSSLTKNGANGKALLQAFFHNFKKNFQKNKIFWKKVLTVRVGHDILI